MSFFFDVLTLDGFVLASDVRLICNGELSYKHKLRSSPYNSAVKCAVAFCGDYCTAALDFFSQAVARKDTLKDVAQDFAQHWTGRFAGTDDYSAVHLVGYETIPETDAHVPQLWFWCNWTGKRYCTEDELGAQLRSFSDPIPFNNHIPELILRHTGKSLKAPFEEERFLVRSFLALYGPYFTWNGDTDYWRSAADIVASAMNLVRREKRELSIDEVCELTKWGVRFLAQVGSLLSEPTVGLSPKEECDVLAITPTGVERKAWADLSAGMAEWDASERELETLQRALDALETCLPRWPLEKLLWLALRRLYRMRDERVFRELGTGKR